MNSPPLRLANQFLIAMPELRDPNFFHGVTYLCEHNEEGAMGLMINRPLDITMGEVLQQMNIDTGSAEVLRQPIFLGGPVQCERGFVLHKPHGNWEVTMKITDEIGVTSSRDIIEAIARGEGPARCLITLGYAGWGPGQLEQELAENAWINVSVDDRILFEVEHDLRWEAAAALTGVDIHRLSADIGHA
ncbi:MAG: YqgE/AlgH family protein [Gammaproteobacteria bacterium]|jgi:putative transcriptional regulator|nr:YqgE/AlgH family protein [Gammaproteobacteria bacterium]